ncbi:MAG: hypothetical protein BGP11_11050 [Rhodobacterales bacterium 65-51]|nr:MAG: hypothetical protein BGP11_11050 [Rhodobacterales bacterium 65-51]
MPSQRGDSRRALINGDIDLTTTLTKADLATKLAAAGQPLTASQIKNATIADLSAMFDAIVIDVLMPGADAPALPDDATPKQVKAVRVPKPAKARTLFMRKPGREAKTAKAGTRRTAIMQALLKDATYDEISKLCIKDSGEAWTKAATRSACTTWPCSLGYGIEERDGAFHLIMSRGMDSPIS